MIHSYDLFINYVYFVEKQISNMVIFFVLRSPICVYNPQNIGDHQALSFKDMWDFMSTPCHLSHSFSDMLTLVTSTLMIMYKTKWDCHSTSARFRKYWSWSLVTYVNHTIV